MDFERVEVTGLVKVYGATRDLIGVDAAFDAGRVTVVEGPNGSGKTTLLNVLAQLVRPTRGEVRYGEHTAATARAIDLRAEIGILAHSAMIYPDLSARENLALYIQLHGLSEPKDKLATAIERFEIGRWGERAARTYSRGQLQRLALARALMHSPRLLLLDEPSTGLDARSVERLVMAVSEERERGAIIVLITHDSRLAERLADARLSLKRGKVVS